MCTEKNLPRSILARTEKIWLSALVSLFGLSSGFNSPIYWVALPELQKEFHIDEEKANLTITIYLVFQSCVPVIFGALSDKFGRRPIVLYLLIGSIASNVGTANCNSYATMMICRALVAIHGSPFWSLSSAISGDFTTKKERGGIIGFTFGFTLIGVGIAPFIGSLLDNRWGWRGIFWFMTVFDCIVFVLAIVFYPETRRSIVGNMGIYPKRWINRSPVLMLLHSKTQKEDNGTLEKSSLQFSGARKLLTDPVVMMALIPNAISYSTWTMTQATLTNSMALSYGYKPLYVGLCFFAPGLACCISTILCGKLLDHVYTEANPNRLYYFHYFNIDTAIFTVLYGWSITKHWHVASVLVFAFMLTFGSMYTQISTSTLLVDLYPTMSGLSSALNNLFRCGTASILVSCLELMNQKMTIGGTYSFMAGLCIVSSIFVIVINR